MHKLTKTFLHLWMSLASVAGLAFGWAFLAHAQKPAPLIQSQVQIVTSIQPTLEPILTINDYLMTGARNGARSVPMVQNSNNTFPRLRTRGS